MHLWNKNYKFFYSFKLDLKNEPKQYFDSLKTFVPDNKIESHNLKYVQPFGSNRDGGPLPVAL